MPNLRIDLEYPQIKSRQTQAIAVNRQCCKICWWTLHLISVNVTYRYRFQDLGYWFIEIKKVCLNVKVFSVLTNKGLRTIVFA